MLQCLLSKHYMLPNVDLMLAHRLRRRPNIVINIVSKPRASWGTFYVRILR